MKRILYLQYTNPAAYPPLLHSSAMLADAGWEVLFVGIAALGAQSLAIPKHPRIKYQQLASSSGGVLGPVKYAAFGLQALIEAKRFRPDWIYASDAFSAPTALAIRQVSHVRLAYHEHDAPPVATAGPMAAVVKARDQLARTANIVIAPAEARLQMLPGGVGKRFVVWNCPRLMEVVPEPPARADNFRIVYHGSLSRERLTPQFIDALEQLPSHVELHIFGYETQGHTGYPAYLLERARSAGVAGRVRYHGAIPERAELLRRLRGHDLGISTIVPATGDRNLQSLSGASNKAFEYLANSIPVLVTDHPAWCEMFVAPGYGLACDPTDTASIAKAIRTLVDSRERARQMGLAGRERVLRDWNYETQFAPVLAELAS